MPAVTFADCARCPVRRICSAHVPDGEWEHDEGVDPCVVVTRAEIADIARLESLEEQEEFTRDVTAVRDEWMR